MTNTKTNAHRGRPMVTITLSPAGLAELDRRRLAEFLNLPGTRPLGRGEYIEMLLDTTGNPKPKRRRVKK